MTSDWPTELKKFDYFWLMTAAFDAEGFPQGAPMSVQPAAFKRLERLDLVIIKSKPNTTTLKAPPYERAIITDKGRDFLADQSRIRLLRMKAKGANVERA